MVTFGVSPLCSRNIEIHMDLGLIWPASRGFFLTLAFFFDNKSWEPL